MAKDIENIDLSPLERLRIFELMLEDGEKADFSAAGDTISIHRYQTGAFLVTLRLGRVNLAAEFMFKENGRLFASKEYQTNQEPQMFSNLAIDSYLTRIKFYHRTSLAA